MFKDLENMPLFGGKGAKISHEFDFSTALEMDEVRAGFSVEKDLIDAFLKSCEASGENPNIILSSLIELYLKKNL